MTSDIHALSDHFATHIDDAATSVVRVDARRGHSASGVVWSTDGVIVTTDHAIERDDGIEVGLADGRELPATLVGRDAATDLAVLKVDATGLTPAAWGDLEALRVGHLVLALFRPGRTVRAALGIASALGSSWNAPTGGKIDRYLETDLALKPGFSGGLLIDARGRALGLNTTGLVRSTPVTIPAATLQKVVGALLDHGRVPQGYLGIGAYPVHLTPGLERATGQRTGQMVVAIQPGSPAEQAGLLLGDLLLTLDGASIRHPGELPAMLADRGVGSTAALKLVRAGQVSDLTVTIGARP